MLKAQIAKPRGGGGRRGRIYEHFMDLEDCMLATPRSGTCFEVFEHFIDLEDCMLATPRFGACFEAFLREPVHFRGVG